MDPRFRTLRAQQKFSKQTKPIKSRRNSFPVYNNKKQTIQETPGQNINQQILEEYNDFIKNNPMLLPTTEVFDEINRLYPLINTSKNIIEKEAEKQKAVFTLFNPNPDFNQFLQDPLNTPLNVTLTNNSETNLYYFFTKTLYFTYKDSPFNDETGTLNTSVIKDQLGADLHRIAISVNNIVIPSKSFAVYVDNSQRYKSVDYFNSEIIIPEADKEQTPISLNIINLVDLSCIQQNIQFISDSIINPFAKYEIFQMGGNKSLNIIINSQEQYVDWNAESTLIYMDYEGKGPAEWGVINIVFRINFKDLSYSCKINITKHEIPKSLNPQVEPEFLPPKNQINNVPQSESTIQKYSSKISNIGKGAIDYTKQNPAKVATVVGTTAIGATVGTLLATGLFALGGKTKKRSHKKRKNRKTVRKNKQRKTRKSIHKNKQHKTKEHKK
jgi:hypothetical protein